MKKKSILLVENNPDDVELARVAFRESGIDCETVVARDGQEALDLLLAGPAGAQPAVVLLDLKLPRVNGFEVLKRLRAEDSTRYLPVVVLSSSREECDMQVCYRLGANSYIQKPLDFARFAESVKQVALYWLGHNEVPEACL
jgi:two-component system response regulator